MPLKTIVRAACGAAMLVTLVQAPVQAAGSPPLFSQVVAFGDSLSDTGRLFALTAAYFGEANALPQASDYWMGRFSNGPVAVEMLAAGLGVPLNNFAYGGAQTDTTGEVPLTGMQVQVGQFAASLSGNPADAGGLYMVWGGANDLRDITSPADIPAIIMNLGGIVDSLYGLGARNFLLPNMPDLGLTPEGMAGGNPAGATFVSELFNQQLAAEYGGLSASLAGAHFTYVDIMDAQRNVIAGAPGNGFSNVTEGCFSGYVGIPGIQCLDASGYVYWDKVHPTTALHAVLAAKMLTAVPEPATMLMMAVGMLALVGIGRRRQA